MLIQLCSYCVCSYNFNLSVKVIVDRYLSISTCFLLMGVARDLHRRCIYFSNLIDSFTNLTCGVL